MKNLPVKVAAAATLVAGTLYSAPMLEKVAAILWGPWRPKPIELSIEPPKPGPTKGVDWWHIVHPTLTLCEQVRESLARGKPTNEPAAVEAACSDWTTATPGSRTPSGH
jgi:hypothetical protein